MKRQHAISFLLPVSVTVIIPSLLLFFLWDSDPWITTTPFQNILGMILGPLSILIGVLLLYMTISIFASQGAGTLSPHAPTKHLVVSGIYRYVRNPMITGVLFILLGEALMLSSFWILLWFVLAFAINHIYFIKSEEPGLVSRFGDEYQEYRKNVPRWLPWKTPWSPNEVGLKRENE